MSPLTHQEWDILFESHPELQVNPSLLTQNVTVINELRERTLSERFAEIGRNRIRISNDPILPLEEPSLNVEFVRTQISPVRIRRNVNNVNVRVNDL